MITNDDDDHDDDEIDRPTGMEGPDGVAFKLILVLPDLHRETEESHDASVSRAGFQTARI
jgi:hypothetical protein